MPVYPVHQRRLPFEFPYIHRGWTPQACRGELHGLPGVVLGNLGFYVDLGDLRLSPQGSQISLGVVRGTSGFLAHRCRDK